MSHASATFARRALRPLALTATIVAVAIGVAACSGGTSSASTSSGLPAKVTVPVIMDLTGTVALNGKESQKGIEFAVDQLNKQGFLGKTKLAVSFQDSQTDPQRATQLISTVGAKKPPVVIAPITSPEDLQAAPIAQRLAVPFIISGSQADGLVETGNYIFRVTVPEAAFQKLSVAKLKSLGIKNVATVYTSSNSACQAWATTSVGSLLPKAGMKAAKSIGVAPSQTDFSSIVTLVNGLGANTAVGACIQGPGNATMITQLRDQGFTGPIFGDENFASGNLAAAGDKANGAFYASPFAPTMDNQYTKAFVSAWEKANGGAKPDQFNADGYNTLLLAASGIKQANSIDPAKVRVGIQTVTDTGLNGSEGHLTFDQRDARGSGVLLYWNGTAFTTTDK